MAQDNSQVQEFDLIVIGAGSGGVRAARISAQHGAKVAVVESSRLGGTCVNLGCVPKKLMAYASHFARDFQDAKGYGWTVNSPEFSWKTLIENKNAEIDRLNGIYGGMLEKNGVELYRGLGRYLKAANAKHIIRVDQEEGSVDICAKRVLIATGGKADRPDIPGAEHMLVSDDLFYLEELPKSIAMVGSGYISVEFASIFAGLGVDVHLMIRNDAFLREFDSQLGAWGADAFKERGIHVHQRMNVKSVEKAGDKSVLSYEQDGEVKTLEVDHVVSAIGRSALVPKGVEASIPEGLDKKGFIPVNNKFETSLPGLYAVGDVTGCAALTPVAIKQGHWLADDWFGTPRPVLTIPSIPTAVFTQPAIGTVGASEDELKKNGVAYKLYQSSFRPMKHTLAKNPLKVGIKLIVSDDEQEKVLGMHMFGDEAPEIIQSLAVAFDMGLTKPQLDMTLGVHPTVGEEWVTMRG
ncbi:MAG TPA: glutathione-disulfide reductase [Gammaproteobacteria bacterium]|nr:glutathione-disulfide reductase [Gammaproteobacteria bacterium]